MNISETVKQLLIINIIFYIGSQIVGPPAYDILALHFPQNPDFQFWQPLTYMFMHSEFARGTGIFHILFNMFALVSFGSLLERIWGAKKFLFFYISCGLGAAALHLAVNYFEIQYLLQHVSYMDLSNDTVHRLLNIPYTDSDAYVNSALRILQDAGKLNVLDEGGMQYFYDAAVINQIPTVGASGAIYGLMVAFAFLAPNAELMMMFIPIPIKAKYFVPGILVLDLFLGLRGQSIFGSGGGIAHFAHIGGALVGFIMMYYWSKNSFNNNRWN